MRVNNYAIKIDNVSVNFGSLKALHKVSMTAEKGKVTGLLGPNGAGKSTLIKAMTTLLKPHEGEIFVDGIDVVKSSKKARERIGLAGQHAAVDDFLTGRENLEMVGRLYHMPKRDVEKRAKELIEKLDLVDAADRQVKTYSGGMRRRLDLGASLVAKPKVLFLDEPTTGLDPRTRLQLWDIVREMVAEGVSILLTTQYLDEADSLADYLYIIDHGKMISEGTAEDLKNSLGQDVIEIKVAENNLEKVQSLLSKSFSQKINVDDLTRRINLRTTNGSEDLLLIAEKLKNSGSKPEELSLHRPSLDDVFLAITGKKTDDEGRQNG